MSAVRFPGRDDAVRRLCDAEPALCEEEFADARAPRDFPTGWMVLGLLLALIIYHM